MGASQEQSDFTFLVLNSFLIPKIFVFFEDAARAGPHRNCREQISRSHLIADLLTDRRFAFDAAFLQEHFGSFQHYIDRVLRQKGLSWRFSPRPLRLRLLPRPFSFVNSFVDCLSMWSIATSGGCSIAANLNSKSKLLLVVTHPFSAVGRFEEIIGKGVTLSAFALPEPQAAAYGSGGATPPCGVISTPPGTPVRHGPAPLRRRKDGTASPTSPKRDGSSGNGSPRGGRVETSAALEGQGGGFGSPHVSAVQLDGDVSGDVDSAERIAPDLAVHGAVGWGGGPCGRRAGRGPCKRCRRVCAHARVVVVANTHLYSGPFDLASETFHGTGVGEGEVCSVRMSQLLELMDCVGWFVDVAVREVGTPTGPLCTCEVAVVVTGDLNVPSGSTESAFIVDTVLGGATDILATGYAAKAADTATTSGTETREGPPVDSEGVPWTYDPNINRYVPDSDAGGRIDHAFLLHRVPSYSAAVAAGRTLHYRPSKLAESKVHRAKARVEEMMDPSSPLRPHYPIWKKTLRGVWLGVELVFAVLLFIVRQLLAMLAWLVYIPLACLRAVKRVRSWMKLPATQSPAAAATDFEAVWKDSLVCAPARVVDVDVMVEPDEAKQVSDHWPFRVALAFAPAKER